MKAHIIIIAITIITTFACTAGGIVAYVPRLRLQAAFEAVLFSFQVSAVTVGAMLTLTAAASLLALAWAAFSRGWSFYSDARIKRAEADKATREAHFAVTVAPAGSVVFAHSFGRLQASHQPLHLAAGGVNGTVMDDRRAWSYFQASHKPEARIVGDALQLPAPESIPDLMVILRTAQRVLVKAASDGGKTTLLQHIAAQRIITEAVLILDSQSYPDKWPDRCNVVGTGSNHPAISVALDRLIDLMVRRYKEIGDGTVREGQHPRLTIIIDEWMAIVDQCPNAGDVIRRLLTESRKAAFSVFIGSHSERVKSLGLDGRGDLRDGFLIVRIEIENGQRVATYDTGRGERPCLLPGEFVRPQPGGVIEIEAIAATESDAAKFERWRALVDGGATKTAATWEVYSRSFGGNLAQELNRRLSSSEAAG